MPSGLSSAVCKWSKAKYEAILEKSGVVYLQRWTLDDSVTGGLQRKVEKQKIERIMINKT